MSYLLHRISHEASAAYPLLDAGYLTIGFSDFAYDSFIDGVRASDNWEVNWEFFEKEFDTVWGERSRNRHTLWRFVEGLKQGDTVLVPTYGAFSLYKIVGEKPKPISTLPTDGISAWGSKPLYIEDERLYAGEGEMYDLGFYWEVEPIALEIPRHKFANKALTARMKVRQTNVWIDGLRDAVESALHAYKKNKPINIGNDIIEATTPKILDLIKTKITPDKFEHLVKYYFKRVGAHSVQIPAKNEADKQGDADVIAVFETIKTIIYIQVKHHDGQTDEWAARQISEYVENKENEAQDDGYTRVMWVVSSADSFSDACVEMAKKEKVQLINGTEFTKMLIEAGVMNLSNVL